MSLPDGPKSPELWQQLRWLATPFSFMRDTRQRYGESFTIAIGKGKLSKVVFASHPKDLELNTLASVHSRRSYTFAINRFIAWYCSPL